MGGKKVERQQNDYSISEIIKSAYEKGINESEITVQILMEDLKTDLKRLIIE
jgi:hypothetical protein